MISFAIKIPPADTSTTSNGHGTARATTPIGVVEDIRNPVRNTA